MFLSARGGCSEPVVRVTGCLRGVMRESGGLLQRWSGDARRRGNARPGVRISIAGLRTVRQRNGYTMAATATQLQRACAAVCQAEK